MRGAGRLLIVLMLAASLTGCIGSNTPDWGKGEGQYFVSWDGDSSSQVLVKSPNWKISDYETTDLAIKRDYMNPWGCHKEQITEGNETWIESSLEEGGSESQRSMSPITVSGWLYAAKHFPDGGQDTSAESNLASTAIVITTGDYDEISDYTFENFDKVGVKDWMNPIDVTTTPKLDSGSWTKEGHHKAGEINEQHEEGFANVGLVPSTSNIMFGFRGLEEGKVSVKLQGYLITSYPYVDEYNTVLDEECRIITSMNPSENSLGVPLSATFNFLVTQIEFEGAVVSPQGNAVHEWEFGEVPILGAVGYTIGLIFIGIGGAMTAFIISMRMEHNRARKDAESLLTGEHLKAAKRIKKDIKDAKRKGYDYKQTEAAKKMKKIEAQEQKAKTVKATKKIKGFDLGDVIDSGPATYAIKGAELGGGGVMESEEALQISSEIEEQEEPEDNTMMGDSMIQPAGPTRAKPKKREIARREVAGKKSASARKGPPRKNEDEQSTPPKPKRERKSSIQDDDFSDFSL